MLCSKHSPISIAIANVCHCKTLNYNVYFNVSSSFHGPKKGPFSQCSSLAIAAFAAKNRKTTTANLGNLAILVHEVFARWRKSQTRTGNQNRQSRFSRNRDWNGNCQNCFQLLRNRNRNWHRAIPFKICVETHVRPFPQRNGWNRKPEPLEPFHANRTGAGLF